MTFFKLCKYDLKNGMLKEGLKYLLSVVLFFGFCIGFVYTKGADLESCTFGDFLFYITAGMEEYIPMPGNIFMFPALWVLLILVPLYITLYYPFNDLTEYGKNVLINAKSRSAWWLSKCVWAMTSVFLYFILLWGVIALFCICDKGNLSLDVSKALLYKLIPQPSENIYAFPDNVVPGSALACQILFMPILIVSALSFLQMTISLFIKPFFSFCISAGILVLSAYYLHPLMLGNYAMSQRNNLLINNGVSMKSGIILSVLLLLLSCIIGLLVFKRYDILNKE